MEWWKKLRKYSFSQLTESIKKYFKWTTQEMKLCSISWCIIVRSDSNIWSAVWRSGRLSDGVVGRVWAGSDALQTLLLLPDIPSDRLMLLANQVIWHQTPNRKTITEEVEFRDVDEMKLRLRSWVVVRDQYYSHSHIPTRAVEHCTAYNQQGQGQQIEQKNG